MVSRYSNWIRENDHYLFQFDNMNYNGDYQYIITKEADRLDLYADKYYKDASLWWVIADANQEVLNGDTVFVPPAMRIRIPVDYSQYLHG